MPPRLSEIVAPPDTVLGAAGLDGDVQASVTGGMEHDGVAVIAASAPENDGLQSKLWVVQVKRGGQGFAAGHSAERHAVVIFADATPGDGADSPRKRCRD